MDWIKDFYEFQYSLLPKVENNHYAARLFLVEKFLQDITTKRLLELGAGRGEFAALCGQKQYPLTAIELVECACDIAKKHNQEFSQYITIIQANFFQYLQNCQSNFDVICYWDGFGVGEDADQKHLLDLIAQSLTKEGKAFIEIYSPYFWLNMDNTEYSITEKVKRKYQFDFFRSTMIDCWKYDNHQKCQYLRCYSPVEIIRMVKETPLRIEHMVSLNGNPVSTSTLKKEYSYVIVLTK